MNRGNPHSGAAERRLISPSSRSSHGGGWQLPDGVSPGTWDYVRNHSIAQGYADFLTGDPLTHLDSMVVDRYLPPLDSSAPTKWVAEFGCGNGRTLLPLMKRGYRALGVDLSLPMLREMQAQWDGPASHLACVHANLVELDGLADASVDDAVCLFSTLGMIRHAENRARFLAHARRVIRPGGHFILHAHHVWHQLTHRGGLNWWAKHCVDVAMRRMEFGDRFSLYRGIQNMFIHSFQKREIERLLINAGFECEAWFGLTSKILSETSETNLASPTERAALLTRMAKTNPRSRKTIGWIIVCR